MTLQYQAVSRVLSVVAGITMIFGTVVGVVQTNVKRMLAYSSIAHAGYILLGIVSANRDGKAAILFYLLAYAVTNIGALGIVALLTHHLGEAHAIHVPGSRQIG